MVVPLPPPAGRRTRRTALAAVCALVLLLVVGAGGMTRLAAGGASGAEVGRCLEVDSLADARVGELAADADLDRAPCADRSAIFQVLTQTAGERRACPPGDYIAYAKGRDTLCLGYNVAAGDCFEESGSDPHFTDCAAAPRPSTIRVLRVVDGRSSAKACADLAGRAAPAVRALTYSVPLKTLCVTRLAAATG